MVTKIVLTGGPCAGKTTALARIIEHFTSLGFQVFSIPEVPTIFIQAGMNFLTENKALFRSAEKAVLDMQLRLEEHFMAMAEASAKPALVICDRGAMDISTYMTPQLWDELCRELGTDTDTLRNTRYDAVLHLVTAADGAEAFYIGQNTMRTEGIEKACELDRRLIGAWEGHPHLRVIGNNDNFENKMHRVLVEISNVVGVPVPIEEERKYLVELRGEVPNAVESDIVQTYLCGEKGEELRLRKQSWKGGLTVCTLNRKKTLSPTERVETERRVDYNQYMSLLRQADPQRADIVKHRRTFIWEGQFFELDSFVSPCENLNIMEVEGMRSHEEIKFPPFVRILEDVTGNLSYYNYHLALKQ